MEEKEKEKERREKREKNEEKRMKKDQRKNLFMKFYGNQLMIGSFFMLSH